MLLAGWLMRGAGKRTAAGLSRQSSAAVPPRALAIVAACGLWALDNNLTRRVAGADAVQIAAIKGSIAGSVNLALGLVTGAAIPAIGVAALALPLLGEPVTPILILATAIMAIATWLVLTEAHAHEHTHEAATHAHRHVHDEHHRHSHSDSAATAPHGHEHPREPLTHRHAHMPDLHHRHRH